MRTSRRGIVIGVAAAVTSCALVAAWLGTRREQRALAASLDRLRGAAASNASTMQAGTVRPQATTTQQRLPAPVERYLRFALRTSSRIREVRMQQTGTVRTDTAGRWMPFDAEHVAVPAATGFVWNARVRVAPLLHVRVRDSLIDGIGAGQVSLMSAYGMSAASGGIEMNAGALHRYLAEAVWYPTALRPGPELEWRDIDDGSALATLTSHGISVSLVFRFGDGGEVTGIYTPARWGTFEGGYRQVPWEGHFRRYRERNGVFVPDEGEVGWYIDGEWRAVWKGSLVAYDALFEDLAAARP